MTPDSFCGTMISSKAFEEVQTMKRGGFLMGFLTCLLLAGVTTTAYAAGIMAERSQH